MRYKSTCIQRTCGTSPRSAYHPRWCQSVNLFNAFEGSLPGLIIYWNCVEPTQWVQGKCCKNTPFAKIVICFINELIMWPNISTCTLPCTAGDNKWAGVVSIDQSWKTMLKNYCIYLDYKSLLSANCQVIQTIEQTCIWLAHLPKVIKASLCWIIYTHMLSLLRNGQAKCMFVLRITWQFADSKDL